MRYLVLEFDGEPVRDEFRANGRATMPEHVDDQIVVLALADGDVDLEIGPEDRSLLLEAELVDRFAGPTAAAATPILVPDVHAPRPSTFAPRVTERHAKPLGGDAVVAGTPDQPGMPVNYVGEKLTASYLCMDHPLGEDAFAFGEMRQFETYWEPLGWALDEWIDTLSLAPFEDTVESGIDVAAQGGREVDQAVEGLDAVRAVGASSSSATEAMRTAQSASIASRGWSAGVGGPPEAASANPLIALARGVVGTFQFDFGSARTAVSGDVNADLRSDVVSRLQQATTRQRATSNRSLARTASALGESRRLRALRNLGPGQSVNLALYSVARQWLVSTVEGPARPVVLIRAHECDKDFEHRDLFLHRAVLAEGLLEPALARALDRAAEGFEPSPPPPAAPPAPGPDDTAARVTGKLMVTDPAKGKGSMIEISALFDLERRQQARSTRARASREGTVEFRIELGGLPLSALSGWMFEFDNPGRINLDQNARVRPFDVEIVKQDGETVDVDLPDVHVWPRHARTYPRGFTLPDAPPPAPAAEASADVRRVVEHLDANRPYYRLLIDLAMDPVTRFEHLCRRHPRPPMPVDMQPVGVAGAHLAFLTAHESMSPGDRRPPIKAVLSTPAGGTFLEVLPGRTQIAPAAKTDGWPSVALPPSATLPWPAPIRFAAPDGAGEAPPADAVELVEPAEREAVLPGKVDQMLKSLEALTSQLEALKAEIPKPSAGEDGAAGDQPAG